MKELTYRIKNEFGIHARPAAHMANLASGFTCGVSIFAGAKTADAKGVLGIMGLALKQGDELRMQFDGCDEDAAVGKMLTFLEQTL